MPVNPIPDGYHSVTPYLVIDGAAAAIEFYKSVFGATELMRLDGPNGTVAHAEIKIGNSPLMVSDEWPDMGYRSPKAWGGSSIGIMIYCENADATFAAAVAAGAEVKKPLQDQFYGDRSGSVTDPWGHQWTISTHIEDVSAGEIERRMKSWMEKAA